MRGTTALLFLVGLLPQIARAGDFNGTLTYAITLDGPLAPLMAAIAPNQMVVAVRGGAVRSSVSGGALEAPQHAIALPNGHVINVDDIARTVTTIASAPAAAVPTPVVEAREGRQDILGFSCREYLVTTVGENGPQSMTAWITDGITLPDLAHLGQNGAGGQLLSVHGIEGVALKVRVPNEQANIEIKAVAIDPKKPKANIFKAPKDYTFSE